MKFILFCLAGIVIISCNIIPSDLFDEYCPDDSKNLSGEIKFGKYYNNLEYGYPKEIIGTQEFVFLEDSSFSFIEIYKNKDTTKFLKGKFATYIDPGFAWYALKLSADTSYQKDMGNATGIWKEMRYDIEGKFIGFFDSLLSNVDNKANCFSMAYKDNPAEWRSDITTSSDGRCDKMILFETKTFCMKQNQ
ncbi:hypothetical protein AGMMS49938_08580 [Fibrobacterales bacterium]|nr:hypothetical protein AGMMS49938_08580 [Fibrobacterales bacterium]